MRRFIKVVLAFLLAGTTLSAAEFALDKSHSHVGFSIKHMMITTVKGEFTEFMGELDFDPKTMTVVKFEGTVFPQSINTGIEKRDDHLRSPDFFDVEKYDEISFVMTGYRKVSKGAGEMTGKLTIHGMTKEVVLNVEIGGVVKDPWGKTRLGMSLNGEINRKDFGLTWNKALEAGGVLVGDEVKMLVELETIAQ